MQREDLKQACSEKTSSKRRRRRRISITAGGESEANATCGFTVSKWSVLEEGEHEQAVRRCHACPYLEAVTYVPYVRPLLLYLQLKRKKEKIFHSVNLC